MITTGIVREINISSSKYIANKYKVEINLFQTPGDLNKDNYVLEANCSVASGLYACFNVGDKVYVGFMNNDLSKPIILGKIYQGMTDESCSYAHFDALKVSGKSEFSENTQIGNLTFKDLSSNIAKVNEIEKKLKLSTPSVEGSIIKIDGTFAQEINFIDDPQTQINNLSDAINNKQDKGDYATISDLAIKSNLNQVIRIDSAQTITADENFTANSNLKITKSAQLSTASWYTIGRIRSAASNIKLSITASFTNATPTSANIIINRCDDSIDYFTLTQISGHVGESITKVRVRENGYLDLYYAVSNLNTVYYFVEYDSSIVSFDAYEIQATSETGGKELQLVNGINTSNAIYINGTELKTESLKIVDTRNTTAENRLPNSYTSQRTYEEFCPGSVLGLSGSWYSVTTYKGWADSYLVYQEARNSSNNSKGYFEEVSYFRYGYVDNTWGEWKKVVNSSDFEASKSDSGYTKLPNGMIMQWGKIGTYSNDGNKVSSFDVNFPISFPNKCVNIQVTVNTSDIASGSTTTNYDHYIVATVESKSKALVKIRWQSTYTNGFFWFAIGY